MCTLLHNKEGKESFEEWQGRHVRPTFLWVNGIICANPPGKLRKYSAPGIEQLEEVEDQLYEHLHDVGHARGRTLKSRSLSTIATVRAKGSKAPVVHGSL